MTLRTDIVGTDQQDDHAEQHTEVNTYVLDHEIRVTTEIKGFVNHGSTAGTARPDYVSVEWYGSVQPTNAIAGDTWVDTST